jgi:hypothetical protein
MVQYGKIVHGQNGTWRSQPKAIDGTFARVVAHQLAKP